jgi:hypothetical protein
VSSGAGGGEQPSFSRTVAYLELARGQDCLLQKPETLYSFRQKFWVVVLTEGQWEERIFRDAVLDFVGAKLVVYYRPYYIV